LKSIKTHILVKPGARKQAELPRNEGSTKTAKYEPISTPVYNGGVSPGDEQF
jgi:hypothetical protein